MLNKTCFFIFLLLLINGCGFQLRGAVDLPQSLRVMQLLPNQPYDPFIRTLRQTLIQNGTTLTTEANNQDVTTLSIISQTFSERITAYGADGQANQSLIKLNVTYQLIDNTKKITLKKQSVMAERELTLNPRAILATDSERERLKKDLQQEAALRLVRQLSVLP